MPIYLYENPATGEKREELRSMADRASAPAGFERRFAVPVAAVGFAKDPSGDEVSTMRTLAHLEERLGTKELERQSGYSANALRSIWREENAPAYAVPEAPADAGESSTTSTE